MVASVIPSTADVFRFDLALNLNYDRVSIHNECNFNPGIFANLYHSDILVLDIDFALFALEHQHLL